VEHYARYILVQTLQSLWDVPGRTRASSRRVPVLIEIVRSRCTVTRADSHGGIDRIDQTELLTVDQLPFLTLLDPFNRQTHLFFELIEWIVAEVRNTCMDANYSLHGRERIFMGMCRVIDKSLGNLDVFCETRNEVNVAFTVAIHGRTQLLMLSDRSLEVVIQIRQFAQDRIQILTGQREQDTGCDGPDRHIGRPIGHQVSFTKEFTFREQCHPQIAAVAPPSTVTISPSHLAELSKSGAKPELIDVRTPVEYREVHVEFARNVPLDQLDPAGTMASRTGTAGQPLYVVCRSGSRDQQACDQFAKAGFTNVVNVEGGTIACEQADALESMCHRWPVLYASVKHLPSPSGRGIVGDRRHFLGKLRAMTDLPA
jgi:rhodanese-related sulfurtransferase